MSVAGEPTRTGAVFASGRAFRRTGSEQSWSVVERAALTAAAALAAFAAFARTAVFTSVLDLAAASALIAATCVATA
jgi:uncharacterized protein YciI